MVPGIIICGLNGSGKSTLGRAYAKSVDLPFIDDEALYFSEGDLACLHPRSHKEADRLFADIVQNHRGFVYAAVMGKGLRADPALYRMAVYLDAPAEERLRRVQSRSLQLFGGRVLPGGDLYEHEQAFFRSVRAKRPTAVNAWLATLSCPVLRMDGALPLARQLALLQ